MFRRTKYLFPAIALILIACKLRAQGHQPPLPFLLLDEQKLATCKKHYREGDQAVTKEIDSLVTEAERLLSIKPYSVTNKKKLPPSGDKHDYMSQAPYWWPDPARPDGRPYIRKDGRINPERNLMQDREQMGRLCHDVQQLALAYYFTGKEPYAQKAVELMNAWFLDKATRMNPNLNYGQGIPGICDGRGIGIIETVGLTNIPDALALMNDSKSIYKEFVKGIRHWFRHYTDWLVNSRNGKEERAQINNHGTYYDLQVADFALFLGTPELARKVIKEQTVLRIDQQFTVDGAQPLELIRTKSWGYTTMNLLGWTKLARLADRLHMDLWHTETVDGKGIRRGVEWFLPYVLKEKNWPYEQIEPAGNEALLSIYQLAAEKYPGNFSQKVFERYPGFNRNRAW